MDNLIIGFGVLSVVVFIVMIMLLPKDNLKREKKIDILIKYLKENYKNLPPLIIDKLNETKSSDTSKAQEIINEIAECFGQICVDKHLDCLLIEISATIELEKIEQNNKEE